MSLLIEAVFGKKYKSYKVLCSLLNLFDNVDRADLIDGFAQNER